MDDKKTIGERIDAVVEKATKEVENARDKISTAKDKAANIAFDLSDSVKKAINDSGSAVSELTHNKTDHKTKK